MTLYWAPEKAKLIAYKTLCRPHPEYAAAVWDPSSKKAAVNIEQVQKQAVRFVAGIKGRGSSDEARSRLGLTPPLQNRCKDLRLSLLMRILVKEEYRPSLLKSYEHLMDQPTASVTTRSQPNGMPTTFRTNTSLFHNHFLPRTICDMKITPNAAHRQASYVPVLTPKF